jgi:5-formyltetrahydrofolate cyclo-ligase
MSGVAVGKKEWRTVLKMRLQAYASLDLAAVAQPVVRRLIASAWWQEARVIGLYAALPSEVNLTPLDQPEFLPEKTILFPRCHPENKELSWHQVRSSAELVPGAYDIREPDPRKCAEVDPTTIDLLLVPGLGFDGRGGRLGRGHGYYDRLFARLPQRTHKLGVFFSWQELDEVPELPHDARLDGYVTEQQLTLISL